MSAQDLPTLIDTLWETGNVTKPDIIEEPQEGSRAFYKRVVSSKRIRKIEDVMGVVGRTHYTPDSHDAWDCWVVSDDVDDCIDMVNEIRRMCAQYTGSSTEALMQWEGGDWYLYTSFRYEFHFIVFVRVSGRAIPNA